MSTASTRRAIGAMVLLLVGCAGPSVSVSPVPPKDRFDAALAVHTAGHAGCPHAEIEIVDYHVVRADRAIGEAPLAETWTARCRGRTLFCSANGGSIACTPEVGPAAASSTVAPPAQ